MPVVRGAIGCQSDYAYQPDRMGGKRCQRIWALEDRLYDSQDAGGIKEGSQWRRCQKV